MRIFNRHLALTALCTLAACDTTAAETTETTGAALTSSRVPRTQEQVALESLRAHSATPAEVRIVDGYPRTVTGRWATTGNTYVERARNFLATYDALFRSDVAGFTLVVERVLPNDEGVVFQQLWGGAPVIGAELTVLFQRTNVIGTLGSLATTPLTLAARPNLAGDDAVTIVSRAHELGASHLPTAATLVVLDARTAPGTASVARLAWRVNLGEQGHAAFVDAHTGVIVQGWSTGHSLDASEWDLQLEDANGENSVTSTCYYFTNVDEAAGDEYGVYPSHENIGEFLNLHDFAGDTWDFYLETFGRDSYDDDGGQYEVFGASSNSNAGWFTACGNAEFSTAYVGPDIMTHEMTHAVISETSEIIYSNESGAINEMFADVMSALQHKNWQIGQLSPIDTIRDMTQLMHYDFDWVTTTSDNGGVHSNSGIGNYAFFLLTMGGNAPGVAVQGIGYDKALKLAYAVMTKTVEDARYDDILALSKTLAKSWLGSGWTQQDVCDIQNAWNAVGIGFADTNCNGYPDIPVDWDLDGVPDQLDNCPFVVNPAQTETLPSDGQGDVCDTDDDDDGVPDLQDNCATFNPDQRDINPVDAGFGDGIGDVCQDVDGDTYVYDDDNCPDVYNPTQADKDYDGIGDACAYDMDKDGIHDNVDNCLNTINTNQKNGDGDLFGDVCDLCPATKDEGGAYTMGIPELGILPKPIQKDSDADGLGDMCDPTPFGNVGRVHRHGAPFVMSNPSRGERFDAKVDLAEGGVITLDLPLCANEPCAALAYEAKLALDLNGLPAGVGAMIVDDFGNVVSQARNGGERTLRFTPRGGRDYRLVLIGGVRAANDVSIRFYETTRHR